MVGDTRNRSSVRPESVLRDSPSVRPQLTGNRTKEQGVGTAKARGENVLNSTGIPGSFASDLRQDKIPGSIHAALRA